MKIFGLLTHAILTMVRKTPLDTSLARPFVTCITILVTTVGNAAIRL